MGEGKILPGSIQLQTQFVMIPYGHIAIINAKKKSITIFFFYHKILNGNTLSASEIQERQKKVGETEG